jgi:hypothetical protein
MILAFIQVLTGELNGRRRTREPLFSLAKVS